MNDDDFKYISGINLCVLALSATLIDKGVISRKELLDMIDVLIDWASLNLSEEEAESLSGLREMLESSDSDLKMKEIFELSNGVQVLDNLLQKKIGKNNND